MQTATVQMCSSPEVAANLASAHALLTQAAAQGAEQFERQVLDDFDGVALVDHGVCGKR